MSSLRKDRNKCANEKICLSSDRLKSKHLDRTHCAGLQACRARTAIVVSAWETGRDASSDVKQLGLDRIHGVHTNLLVCQQVAADAPRIVLTAIVKLSGMFICDSKNVIFQHTEESFLMLCPPQSVHVHNPSAILVLNTGGRGESLSNSKYEI